MVARRFTDADRGIHEPAPIGMALASGGPCLPDTRGCFMPRRIRDIAGSVLALLVLFFVLVSLDDRVKERFRQLFSDASDVTWTDQPSALGNAMVDAASRQGIDSLYLITFLCVGVVLVLLMLRT